MDLSDFGVEHEVLALVTWAQPGGYVHSRPFCIYWTRFARLVPYVFVAGHNNH